MWGAIARGIGGAIVGEVSVALALNTSLFDKGVKNSVKGAEKSFGSSFSNIAKMAATAFSVKQVWDFGKASVDAASASQSAWTGLYSIVDGTGKSFASAKGFIEEYISDGLVPLENATTAYKNLASRGYSTEQIENTLTALKDAAAFGRQASYTLGDAVTSATEGLKNENSILVDNAGVTKNVAKMWDEYAKSIGTTANDLTQQQKIQAEYNGIMAETKFQTGDAATYTNTFAGRTAQLSTAFLNLKTAVGKVVGPIASVFIPVITNAMNVMTKFFNKIQQVLSVFGLKWQDVVAKDTSSSIAGIGNAASSTAESIGDIGDSASSTAKKLKRSLGSMDELNVLSFNKDSSKKGSSGLGDVSSALGGATGMFDNTITEDPVSPQIKKIADKIKSYLEPLKNINLDNLSNAFGKVKKSLEPITKKLGEGAEWLWFNVLVPFTTWTIEDAIPSFFNATAGALDFFNGVMDFAKPYLLWLWDEFLQPIANWTGGVIVDTLNWMGDGLSKVGKFLSEHAPTLKEVKDELEPFSKLLSEYWKVWENIAEIKWDVITKALKLLWTYALKPLWDYFLKPLFTQYWSILKGLASIITGIFEAFNKLMEGDWKGAGKSIVDGLVDGIVEIWDGSFIKKYLYDPIVGGFKKLFGIHSPSTVFMSLGTDLFNGLKNAFTGIGSWVSNLKTNILNGLSGLWAKGKEKGADLYNGLTAGLGNMRSWASGKLADIQGGFSGAWSTFKSIGENMWNGLKNAFSYKSLGLKVTYDTNVGALKKGVYKALGLQGWPKLSFLAQGGWVAANNPQLAVVGDNKREGEIIAPESKIYEQTLKAVKDAGGTGGKQQIEIVIHHKYEDGRTIIQKINQAEIDAGEILLLT